MTNNQNPAQSAGLSAYMAFCHAVLPDEGEDSFAFSFRGSDGILGVFDGCGGLGARKYPCFESRTGAFVASRMMAYAMIEFFEEMPEGQNAMARERGAWACEQLRVRFEKTAQALKAHSPSGRIALSGSMVRGFPTTASIAMVDFSRQEALDILFLWAGDSRGYLFRPSGLVQCTEDDLVGRPDAFENLYADAPLENTVNADDAFRLNRRAVRTSYPAIVFTATDGVFGYLSSPMEFERILLDTMENSSSMADWQERLQGEICRHAGDDSTITLAAFGWHGFAFMQRDFAPRLREINGLLSQVHGDSTAIRARAESVWRVYREKYYGAGDQNHE